MKVDKNTSLRILIGFDFGMKRIGVAIGQTVTKSARPLDTLKAKKGVPDWQLVAKIIKKWQPDACPITYNFKQADPDIIN